MNETIRISLVGVILSVHKAESHFILLKTIYNELIPIEVDEQRNQIKNKIKKLVGKEVEVKGLLSENNHGKLFFNILKLKNSNKFEIEKFGEDREPFYLFRDAS